MDRAKDFAENFNPDTDKITFTFCKTLYQTGEKKTIISKYSKGGYDTKLYQYILQDVLLFIHMMLHSDSSGTQREFGTTNIFKEYKKDLKNLNDYMGISAEIIKNADSEMPDTLTVIYIPDVSKYSGLVYSDITDTRHSCDFECKIKNTENPEPFNNAGMNARFETILDDIHLNGLVYYSICIDICVFIQYIIKYETNKWNIFTKYDVHPMDVLEVLYDSVQYPECTQYLNNHNNHTISEFDTVSHRSEFFSYKYNKFKGNIGPFNSTPRKSIFSAVLGSDDDYTCTALSGTLAATKYWNIPLSELRNISKKQNIRNLMSGELDEHALDTITTELAPYLTKNFGHDEFLNTHSATIEQQLNNFANACRQCMGISEVNLTVTYKIPTPHKSYNKHTVIQPGHNNIFTRTFKNPTELYIAPKNISVKTGKIVNTPCQHITTIQHQKKNIMSPHLITDFRNISFN